MGLETDLKKLVNEYALELPARTWVYETDRWEHLVFCLLRQLSGQNPEKARSAVTILRDIGLLDLEELAVMEGESPANLKAFSQVLRGAGFTEGDTIRAANLLAQVAGVIKDKYAGKVHRIFRHYGEVIRDELVKAFSGSLIPESELREGVSYWLQSAFSMPIPVERQAVLDYCEEQETTPENLWQAADDLGINLGIVDFLLERQLSPEPAAADVEYPTPSSEWKLT
jgi:hypothetical protein